MSKIELIQHLFGYDIWANDKILEAASKADADALVREKTGFGSVLATLAHIAGAQAIWHARWTMLQCERRSKHHRNWTSAHLH